MRVYYQNNRYNFRKKKVANDDIPEATGAQWVKQIPVLEFHKTSTKDFEQKIKYLVDNNYQTITVKEFFRLCQNKIKIDRKTVILTADDNYDTTYSVFYKILKKYNLLGTINIVNSTLDTPGHISTSQLKEMASSGIIEVGSHTYNLAENVAQISQKNNETKANYEARLYADFKKSRDGIKTITGINTDIFALPFGAYNTSTIQMANKVGFNKILTSERGLNNHDFCLNGRQTLKRFAIEDGTTTLDQFKEMVAIPE